MYIRNPHRHPGDGIKLSFRYPYGVPKISLRFATISRGYSEISDGCNVIYNWISEKTGHFGRDIGIEEKSCSLKL